MASEPTSDLNAIDSDNSGKLFSAKELNTTAKPPKIKTEYQKAYRKREKATKNENKQESTAKPPKTNAERQKAFRERQKINKRESTAKPPKTNAEHQKAFRERQKINKRESTAKPPKTNAERQKAFRERQKINKRESTAKPPKTNAERQKAFRERQKINKRERGATMPKYWNKQRGCPGFPRDSRRNAYNNYQNFQGNSSQDCYSNRYYNQMRNPSDFYGNSGYQTNYNQHYGNNYFEPGFQRNFTQNRGHTNLNHHFQPSFSLNADFMPIYQRNTIQKSKQSPNEQNVQSEIRQNDTTTNITENTDKGSPWYEYEKKSYKERRKNMPKGNFLDNYAQKTENFNEKGYIIKETLYQDPKLFYANNSCTNDSTSNTEDNNDWTDTFWQKHDVTGASENPGMSQSCGIVSRKNQNKLERTLNDMLAKPAEMSKGKSLLLKMGWQGGGLGRTGDGIVEPIAPKATYAVNTIGLGHLTEQPKKPTPFARMKKKKLKQPEFQNNFCTNALLYILEFVKNDAENKIVFEPRLTKLERKRIHQIVEKIRESDNLDYFVNFEKFSDKHLELVKEIWVHNCYELWTESEGEGVDRRICLFKEAPAHVYLVTPEDLTKKDESSDKTDGKKGINNITDHNIIKHESVSKNSDSDKGKGTDGTINCVGSYNIDRLHEIKKEIANSTDSPVVMDVDENSQILVKNENSTLEMAQKVKNIDFCDEIIQKTEKIISETNIHSSNSKAINNNHLEVMVKSEQIIVKNEINNTNDVTDINICDEVKVKMEINEPDISIAGKDIHMDDLKAETSTNLKCRNNVKLEIDNNAQTIKLEDEKGAKDSVLAKIVEYFKEFSSDVTFKEFRFLGPFSDEEIMNINAFFDICMKLDGMECDERTELLATFENGSTKFDVLEDNNGKRFIQKVSESSELPSEDEDVICIN